MKITITIEVDNKTATDRKPLTFVVSPEGEVTVPEPIAKPKALIENPPVLRAPPDMKPKSGFKPFEPLKRTCEMCPNDISRLHPRAKVCSDECRKKKNAAYAKEYKSGGMQPSASVAPADEPVPSLRSVCHDAKVVKGFALEGENPYICNACGAACGVKKSAVKPGSIAFNNRGMEQRVELMQEQSPPSESTEPAGAGWSPKPIIPNQPGYGSAPRDATEEGRQ